SQANGSRNKTIWVLNETGIDKLGIQRIRIVGEDADAFVITGHTGSFPGFIPSADVFTPGMRQVDSTTPLSMSLRFSPTKLGEHTATLEVYHDGSNESPLLLPLIATGSWDAGVSEVSDIDF